MWRDNEAALMLMSTTGVGPSGSVMVYPSTCWSGLEVYAIASDLLLCAGGKTNIAWPVGSLADIGFDVPSLWVVESCESTDESGSNSDATEL